MATGNIFSFSDLYNIHNIVQSTNTAVIKQLVISQLRDFFSRDSYFHFQMDPWGFPKTVDLTDVPSDAGLHDNITTRLYIGEYFRQTGGIYYPAILVKSGSMKSQPLSINRERETVIYNLIDVVDGYGLVKQFRTPKAFRFAGYWAGDITIDILSRGPSARDQLQDLVMMLFTDIAFQEMEKSGVIIKEISSSTPSETDDRNDKLFKQTITLNILAQWRREIPVQNTVDMINFCLEFGHNINTEHPVIAPNLTISTKIDLIDEIVNIVDQKINL